MPDKDNGVTPKHAPQKPNYWPTFRRELWTYCKTTYTKQREYYSRYNQPIASFLRLVWNKLRSPKFANNESMVAIFTAFIFVGSVVYSYFAFQQWQATKESADAAKEAAHTAHDALVLSQRPWIKIKHRIVRPLNFGFVGAAGPAAIMTVEDTLENLGKSVALNVVSWEDIIPLDPDMSTTTARKRQNDWCNANKRFDPKSRTQLSGYVLFPHDPLIHQSGIGARMSTVRKAVENNAASDGRLFKDPSLLAGKVAFAMVGCVVYRSFFDPDGTRPYVTGFIYHLGEPQNVGIKLFVLPKGIADNLQLVKIPDGDFAY